MNEQDHIKYMKRIIYNRERKKEKYYKDKAMVDEWKKLEQLINNTENK